MGISCGSQCVLCTFPVSFDTYKGCSHGCRYCFVRNKSNIDEIRMDNCVQALRNFIAGKRSATVNWCDWDIPLHWGGLSDPFQPLEAEARVSLDALRVFEETQYPFIVSTKGRLLVEEPYLSILSRCNCVVQISMVCSSYDRMEPGAPTFDERLGMVRKLAGKTKRLVVRAQPYITDIRDEFLSNIPRIAEAGADAITVEGMKFKRKKPTLVKVGGDWCYPEDTLRGHYELIRDACHENGLLFLCAENRLRPMGDSPACCCGDVEGFVGNAFNAVNLANGLDVKPTENMCREGTGSAFHSIHQESGLDRQCKEIPFATHVVRAANDMRMRRWAQR